MHSVGIPLKTGQRRPTTCNNPCINLAVDNLPRPSSWEAAETNFRFHCYWTPKSTSPRRSSLAPFTAAPLGIGIVGLAYRRFRGAWALLPADH
jgi:hypothetical protein